MINPILDQSELWYESLEAVAGILKMTHTNTNYPETDDQHV